MKKKNWLTLFLVAAKVAVEKREEKFKNHCCCNREERVKFGGQCFVSQVCMFL